MKEFVLSDWSKYCEVMGEYYHIPFYCLYSAFIYLVTVEHIKIYEQRMKPSGRLIYLTFCFTPGGNFFCYNTSFDNNVYRIF